MTARSRPAEKNFFNIGGGLLTEASPLAFPDEYSFDEENLEIVDSDLSRKRRPGIQPEPQTPLGLDLTPYGYMPGDAVHTFTWMDAGEIKGNNLVVLQIGTVIHFFFDGPTLGASKHPEVVELASFILTSEGGASLVQTPVSFTSGKGKLFIAARTIEPLMITFEGPTNPFVAQVIGIQVREFKDIDDGIGNWAQIEHATGGAPFTEDCPNSHEYNLRNRGWIFNATDTGAWKFAEDEGVWPSKAYIPYFGYVSKEIGGITTVPSQGWLDLGHRKEWDSDKLSAELFGNTETPKGSLIINPFDTTVPVGAGGGIDVLGNPFIYDGVYDPVEDKVLLTVNLYGSHGVTLPATVAVSNLWLRALVTTGGLRDFVITSPQVFDIEAVPGPTSLEFFITLRDFAGVNISDRFDRWTSAPWQGSYKFDESFINDDAEISLDRFSSVAFYAGRLVLAGLRGGRWSDHVFFSRVAYDDRHYGWCFQAQDPTHPIINMLASDDGGTIQIPGAGTIIDMVPFEASLIVLATNGIWEISGSSYFAADDIRLRKLTNSGAVSVQGTLSISNGLLYTSHEGVFSIGRDPQTGALVANNIIASSIQTYWNDLTYDQQIRASLHWDDSRNQVWVLHHVGAERDEFAYNTALVISLKNGGIAKYTFTADEDCWVAAMQPTSQSAQPDEYQKMKFFVLAEQGQRLLICDQSQPGFVDYCGTERVPFLLTGHDNLDDFTRRRYVPYVHVFSRKTETGYTEDGPVNESSIIMESRWDFADLTISGKFGPPQQVYRHVRAYTPTGPDDGYDDGHPVLITKNKVRGRGRVVQLKFTGEPGKDFHLLGFSVLYKGVRNGSNRA